MMVSQLVFLLCLDASPLGRRNKKIILRCWEVLFRFHHARDVASGWVEWGGSTGLEDRAGLIPLAVVAVGVVA